MEMKSKKENLKGVSRARQNKEAMQLAIREEGYIFYGSEHPLVINGDCKVLGIVIRREDEEEYEEMVSAFDLEKDVRIYFKDRNENSEVYETLEDIENSDRTLYTVDIHTTKTLDEFEDALIRCHDEEQIYEIQE